MVPEVVLRKAVFVRGSIVVSGHDNVVIEDCLFDSGAIHSSFIRKEFVDKHRDVLRDCLFPSDGAAKLADNGTIVRFSEVLIVTVLFEDSSGVASEGVIEFCVLPSLSVTAIVGLPEIVCKFLSLFGQMLRDAADLIIGTRGDTEAALSMIKGDLVDPWELIDDEAPEERDVDIPCSFPDFLHYMEMSVDEARQEYLDLLDAHTSAEFKAIPGALDWMRDTAIDVFVPSNWEGIRMPPIEFKWKEGMPDRRELRARPVNVRLLVNAKREFDRLMQYMYEWSDSPIVSPLVIAPKATKPFIRFCGDYGWVNNYILRGHSFIPHIRHSLEKICKFKYFVDIDLVNAYHQFRLGDITSNFLSVITPWGQVKPKFLPEGVAPATDVMQNSMLKIFGEFDDWSIVIFDNMLVLADNPDDAFRKLKVICQRAREFNVFLKLAKTWICVEEVTFFGYICRRGAYGLSDARKQEIAAFPFPDSTKKMKSFLGSAGFFAPFVMNFSVIVAPLHDMTKKTFDWKRKETWKVDYAAVFEHFKKALQDAVALAYPDYELRWILRTDASDVGIGWVLVMVRDDESAACGYVELPISFGSRKFSDQARKWNVIEKEAYAIYCAFRNLEYWLRAKPFELETDHRNLKWMEKSENAKIIRWRIYLQGFAFLIRDIPRSHNAIADWASKFYSTLNNLSGREPDSVSRMLSEVHGSRSGHHGIRRTWNLLNKYFPGHRVPYAVVAEFIWNCGICQKFRLGMNDRLDGIVRHLKVENSRSAVGVDALSLEVDKHGYSLCYVFRNFFTKFVGIYPAKDHSKESLAGAIFWFCTTYGLFDVLVSDPGSEMTSEAVALVNKWFGIHHRISLVDRHESNGVEGANKDILRYLKTLLADERSKDRWSEPSLIQWVMFILNSFSDSETGVSPYVLTFGSKDAEYFRIPDGLDASTASSFVRQLDDDLQFVREKTAKFQKELIRQRLESSDELKQNQYQPGDFVLFQQDPNKPLPSKLSPRYVGPYVVISQYKNDVSVRHIVLGFTKDFHVDDLKIFHGNPDDAYKAALLDQDQFEIDRILAHRGDPHMRTSMEFYIRFKDGSTIWRTWDKDLFDSIPYEEYCRSKPPLFQLVYTINVAKQEAARLNKLPITEVSPGDLVYVDLRWYGAEWYRQINLPDKDFKTYVVVFRYERLASQNRKIVGYCETLNDRFTFDHVFVREYGSVKKFDADYMILVDSEFLKSHPEVSER